MNKNELTSLISRLAKFGNNFAFLMLNFVPWVLFSSGIAILLGKAAEYLNLPVSIVSGILRIMLCIIPIFPTMRIWKCRNEFGGEPGLTDGIMDCCFTIWFMIILFIIISK